MSSGMWPATGPGAPGGRVKRDLACWMMRVLWAPSPPRRSLMAHPTTPRLRAQIHRLSNPKPLQPELGIEAVLPKATVERVLKEEGGWWKAILYTPWVTFWAFFWQRLSPDRSCRAALKRRGARAAPDGRGRDGPPTQPHPHAPAPPRHAR